MGQRLYRAGRPRRLAYGLRNKRPNESPAQAKSWGMDRDHRKPRTSSSLPRRSACSKDEPAGAHAFHRERSSRTAVSVDPRRIRRRASSCRCTNAIVDLANGHRAAVLRHYGVPARLRGSSTASGGLSEGVRCVIRALRRKAWGRGIKRKVARARLRFGCLIYSDPRDDGATSRGDVFPPAVP